MRGKALKNTNLVASRHIKRESASLPVDMRRSKTSLLKLPHLRAKEDVREKTGECFQDLEERRWQENDKNAEKSTQDLLFPSRGPLHFVTTTRLCPRAQYKKRSILGGDSPLPISFSPPPLSAPDTEAKRTKHDMKPHPNNSLPTFKAECRT